MAALEGVGDGSVTGETRRRIMESLEATRARVLAKALEAIIRKFSIC